MRILSLTLLVLLVVSARSFRDDDSPHGEDLGIGCEVCHSPKGWKLDPSVYSFDHNSTEMPLTGQHRSVNCRLCHPTLVFSDAGTDCSECHTDMHYQTVGLDCERCHNTHSWIVNNITDIHRMGRFPLIGPHLLAECSDCHPSASLLRFEPLRTECIDCHREDYMSASNPNHVLANMSTECTDCHSMHAFSWTGSGFNHLFFPLAEGHAIQDDLGHGGVVIRDAAEAAGGVALWIQVHQHDRGPRLRQAGGEVDRGRRLADAALLVGHRVDHASGRLVARPGRRG